MASAHHAAEAFRWVTNEFTGEVSLQSMIRDSMSGELLAVGADRRVGGNQLGAATFTNWAT